MIKTKQKNKESVPKLRFPDFYDEWKRTKVANLGKFKSGIGFSENEQGGNRGIPFYKVSDMNIPENKFKMSVSNNYVTESQIKNNKYKVISQNSIIFAKVGAAIFLERKRIANNFLLDNNMMAFIPRGNILFYKYLFDNTHISRFAQIGALPSYNSFDIGSIKVFIPSKEEQQKIADFLGSVDKWLENLREQKEFLEEYKKGIIQKIFLREIRFKDNNGKEFPKWEEKRLGEVGKFLSGHGFGEKEQGGKIGIPFYKVSDMNNLGNEKIMKNANHYVTKEQISRLKYKVIKNKSIIFAKVGAAIFLERKRIAQNFLLDNNMMAFIPKTNVAFFKYIFEKTKLSRFANVGALPSYNSSDLKSLISEIPPSKLEQQKITDFLTSIDDLIELKQQQIIQGEKWKKGLMQGLFI